MLVCAQYNVELRQNCTKVVDLTTVGKMDNLRTYQKMFLMTKKEIEFLYEQFKTLDKSHTFSLSTEDLKSDLTVFGFNYPPEITDLDPTQNLNIDIFLRLWEDEVEKIQLDEDTDHLTFDEFLLLFVRQQSNLGWNKYLPRYFSSKDNYLFDDVSEAIITSRFKPEPTVDDPRDKLYLQKQNPKVKQGNLKPEDERIRKLEIVIQDAQKTIQKLDFLNKTTQNQIQHQLEILRRSTEDLLAMHRSQLEEQSQREDEQSQREKSKRTKSKAPKSPKREYTRRERSKEDIPEDAKKDV